MDYTANYQLPQWVDSDRILRTDFNSMTSAIDAALKTNADGLAAETAARTAKDAEHAAFGNCKIRVSAYVGTGSESARTLTFDQEPLMVLILGENGGYAIFLAGAEKAFSTNGSSNNSLATTWTGASVRFTGASATQLMNYSGVTYHVISFLPVAA